MAHEEWAKKLSPAELEYWALPQGPAGSQDLQRHAAAIAEKGIRQRRITVMQLWITGFAAFAAWGSALAAIVSLLLLYGPTDGAG